MLDDLRKRRDDEKQNKRKKQQTTIMPGKTTLGFAGAQVMGFGSTIMSTSKD